MTGDFPLLILPDASIGGLLPLEAGAANAE